MSLKKLFVLVLALVFAFQVGATSYVSAISQDDFDSLTWSSKYYWKSQQGVCSGSSSSTTATPAPTTTDTTGQSGSAAPTNKDYAGNQILNNAQLSAIKQNQPVYEQAAKQVGIPWQMLAVVHLREHGLQVDNPGNGQGIYQFFDRHGGPYPTGPVSQAEFLRQTILAAQFLQGKAVAVNGAGHKSLAVNSDAETVKDTFFSYNGRASAYAQQAAKLGFNATTQPYEGSPYVMNKADEKRDPAKNPTGWGQIKTDGGGLSYPANKDYGAFVEYGAIAGVLSGASCTVGAVSCNSTSGATSGLSELRQKVVCLGQAEQALWDSGKMKEGFRANSEDSFSKYSQNKNELWCADFVSWIYNQAGYPIGPNSSNWRVAAVVGVQGVGNKNDKFHWHSAGSYAPKPGDLVIHLQNGTSHVNLLTANNNGQITMVGGDQNNKNYNGGDEYPAHSVVSTYGAKATSGVDDITGYVSPD